jgi:hypothetical protein
VDDLEHTYELSHAVVAFSLGYIKSNGEFVRFTNTTVMSNEIVESENKKVCFLDFYHLYFRGEVKTIGYVFHHRVDPDPKLLDRMNLN